MKKVFKSVFLILFVAVSSCEKADIKLYLNSIDPHEYYGEEIIPDSYQQIYGKWQLYEVGGGFSGTGHDLNHDFLEIKRIGIYGIVRNDSLLEYGKIQLDTFSTPKTEVLGVKLVPDTPIETWILPSIRYIHLDGSDKMVLQSHCCDFYDYYYKRSR